MSNIPDNLEEQIQKEYPIAPIEDPVDIWNNSLTIKARECARFGVKIALEDQWIKCSDRLPEKETSVLVLANQSISMYYYGLTNNGDYGWYSCDEQVYRPHLIPTHWMPLPPKPKE